MPAPKVGSRSHPAEGVEGCDLYFNDIPVLDLLLMAGEHTGLPHEHAMAGPISRTVFLQWTISGMD
jgi:hypothetical protein